MQCMIDKLKCIRVTRVFRSVLDGHDRHIIGKLNLQANNRVCVKEQHLQQLQKKSNRRAFSMSWNPLTSHLSRTVWTQRHRLPGYHWPLFHLLRTGCPEVLELLGGHGWTKWNPVWQDVGFQIELLRTLDCSPTVESFRSLQMNTSLNILKPRLDIHGPTVRLRILSKQRSISWSCWRWAWPVLVTLGFQKHTLFRNECTAPRHIVASLVKPVHYC